MPVTIIAEETVVKGGDNRIELNEYDYPLVLEEGGRYIGIESDGEYKTFEKGVVRNIINPTSCVAQPESVSGPSGINASVDDSMTVDLDELNKPVQNVIKVLMTDYAIIHGNTQSVK